MIVTMPLKLWQIINRIICCNICAFFTSVWNNGGPRNLLNMSLSISSKPAEETAFIQAESIDELWIHTGTACNLACPFCLEGSKPGDNRLQRPVFNDVMPYIDSAASIGVDRFSFTGGEPFIVKDFVRILEYAARYKPCLVLTNGTDPTIKRMESLIPLMDNHHPVHFRVSLDHPGQVKHDESRGSGSFYKSLHCLRLLIRIGFGVSVARQASVDEDSQLINKKFSALFYRHGLPDDIPVVSFPDLSRPGTHPLVPSLTMGCLSRFTEAQIKEKFMCSHTRMLVKQHGKMRIYACTLVDDDPLFDMGNDMAGTLNKPVYLTHHRCNSCFSHGVSCGKTG